MAMRWTYGGNPAASSRDAVRWHVGDTDERRKLLDDREIDYALVQYPNELLAAAECALALSGRFTSKSNVTVGSVSKSLGDVAKKYREHADELRRRACVLAGVSFPATNRTDREALVADTETINPELGVGLGDSPFAVQLNDTLRDLEFEGL